MSGARQTPRPAERIRLLLDRHTGRPACALLQAAARADYSALVDLFDGQDWISGDAGDPPVSECDFVLYQGTREEFARVADRLRRRRGVSPVATSAALAGARGDRRSGDDEPPRR